MIGEHEPGSLASVFQMMLDRGYTYKATGKKLTKENHKNNKKHKHDERLPDYDGIMEDDMPMRDEKVPIGVMLAVPLFYAVVQGHDLEQLDLEARKFICPLFQSPEDREQSNETETEQQPSEG